MELDAYKQLNHILHHNDVLRLHNMYAIYIHNSSFLMYKGKLHLHIEGHNNINWQHTNDEDHEQNSKLEENQDMYTDVQVFHNIIRPKLYPIKN